MIQSKWAVLPLGLLAGGLMLSACGGGGSGGGSFSNEPVSISVSNGGVSQLPLNLEGFGPRIGGPFTATIAVEAKNDGGLLSGATFECRLDGTDVDVAALYLLDGSDESVEEVTDPDTGETIEVPRAFRSVTRESNAGGASFHLHAGDQPGRARVVCTVDDPNFDGETRSDSARVEIGGSSGSGDPTEAFLLPRTGLIWPPDFNQPQTDSVDVVLLDENRGIVDDPESGVNNLLVEILSGPNSGEYLVGRNADGDLMRGNALLLSTSDGVADFQVVSGFQDGFIVLGVTSDQFDNNVDNGVVAPVFGATSIVVTTTGSGPSLAILTEGDLSAERGLPYAVQLEASGGVPPYSWSLVGATSLPAGLSLSSTGVLSGIPTQLGESCFLAGVRDSRSPSPQSAGPQQFCVNVTGDPPPAPALSVSTTSLPDGEEGTGYSALLNASGGEPPYTWSLDSDGGATGLEVTNSGVISWTNPVEGTYSLGFTVSDTGGRQDTALLTLQVNQP